MTALRSPSAAGEAALIVVVSFLAGQIVLLGWFHDSLGQIARGYWLFLPVSWAAVRLGVRGTVLVLAVIAIQGFVGARLEVGFFADDMARTGLANYFLFMLCLAIVGLTLAEYLTRSREDARQLRESEAQLHHLTGFLQRVREEDRKHFARDLHDDLGQNLTALRIKFNELGASLANRDPAVVARLALIDKTIDLTVDATRRICDELRPGMLDDLGLEAALASHVRSFALQHGVACELSLDREDYRLDSHLSTAIFRIVQEALTNVARHAQASHALISMQDHGEEVLLTIADDGRGMPTDQPGEKRTHGLRGIRERVILLGGSIGIDSTPGQGTHLEVKLPLRRNTLP